MTEREKVALVSRVSDYLETHLGRASTDNAVLLISLALKSRNFIEFKKALEDEGLAEQFDDTLISALLEVINQGDHLHEKESQVGSGSSNLSTASKTSTREDALRHIESSFSEDHSIRTVDTAQQLTRECLPIFVLKEQLLQAIADYDVFVVVGETGSGKTTQLTQYLHEAGLSSKGRIACTQPRRIAAISAAKRVAEEIGCQVGQHVGYTIRFENCANNETRIKYVTDGMLLREALHDPELSSYSAIVVDEAHERTHNTDVLLSLIKQIMKKRKNLKLIISSSTRVDKFSEFFCSAPVFTIRSRTFPVDIFYSKTMEPNYVGAAAMTALHIHLTQPPGDILIILAKQEEVKTCCEAISSQLMELKTETPEPIVIPLYSALSPEQRARVFERMTEGTRKIVVAANIDETLPSVDETRYVVDSGFVKQKVFNTSNGMDSLIVTLISQDIANQRARRAGRTAPGNCFRLYTQSVYRDEMNRSRVPEILRSNLATTFLLLKAIGIEEPLEFDFLESPSTEATVSALSQLHSLTALEDHGRLSELGRCMTEFPLDLPLSKSLIKSVELGCAEEMLIIIAMLTAQNIFYQPEGQQNQAYQKKAEFHQAAGDHFVLLEVYKSWRRHQFSAAWCDENFVQFQALRKAEEIRRNLLEIIDHLKMNVISCGNRLEQVQKAIVSGFFRNVAKRGPEGEYRNLLTGQTVRLHPCSTLFQNPPEFVIYHELVAELMEYMREVISVEPRWLTEFAPSLFRGNRDDLSKKYFEVQSV